MEENKMKLEQELLEAFELADEPVSLEEASNSRLVQNLTDDSSFAIISACRPNEDNFKRTYELKKDVRKLGYGFNEFVAKWAEQNPSTNEVESSDENSLLIKNIPLKTAVNLGSKYSQASIIYKDKDRIEEICTTDFVDYNGKQRKRGDIVNTFHVDPNKPLNSEVASQIFTGKKAGPASKLVKGKNKKAFQLQEKYLVNAWHGFTYIPIKLDEDD